MNLVISHTIYLVTYQIPTVFFTIYLLTNDFFILIFAEFDLDGFQREVQMQDDIFTWPKRFEGKPKRETAKLQH